MVKMNITEGTLIICVPRELDHHTATEIRERSDSMITGADINRIVFDFSETEFMDSSGIGMIMGRYRQMHYMGGKVAACNMKNRVKKIFCMSGLETIVELIKE